MGIFVNNFHRWSTSAICKISLRSIWLQTCSLSNMATGDSVFVSTTWLSDAMKSSDFKQKFRIVDASWDLPMMKRNFVEEHKQKRICCAKLFDFKECSDKTTDLPHMLPTAEQFAKYVEETFQLRNDHHVVIYDNSERFGLFSAPRIWWTFKVFGHEKVSVLNGGLPKWCKDGMSTRSGEYAPDEALPAAGAPYKAHFHPELVKDMSFMIANCTSDTPFQVVDARPNGRYRGIAPEPRSDIESGHIPKSVSLPFFNCYDMETKIMKSKEEVQKEFQTAGVDVNKPVISSCGSGITASILALSFYYAQGGLIPVYDGSWTEWFLRAPKDLRVSEKDE